MAVVESPLAIYGGLERSELTRNSTISVTIDDLAEGLLVVSFSNNDNLYQGVLFQLNRERGIPSGISFAKEKALENGSTDKIDGDLFLPQPFHKRHSYNPGNYSATLSPRSQPSLRRIIKPPERFKNSRMSLRLRARPVLCGKCRQLCEEKVDTSTTKDNELIKDDNQTDKSKGKNKPCKQDTVPSTNLNWRVNGIDGTQPTTSSTIAPDADPQDLSYESVGSTRVVANYWKRPLVKPLVSSSEATYNRLRKNKVNLDPTPKNKRKRMTSMARISNRGAEDTVTSFRKSSVKSGVQGRETQCSRMTTPVEPVGANEALNNTFVCKSTVCDSNVPITRRRKELSLKMCITKITDYRNEESTKKETECATAKNNSFGIDQDDSTSHSSTSGESHNVCTSKQDKVPRVKSKKKSSGTGKKGNQEWGNRTQNAVPVRYREEGSGIKKSNLNRRRSPLDEKEIPIITICRNEVVDSTQDTTNTEHDEKVPTPLPPLSSPSSISAEESDEKIRDISMHVIPQPQSSSRREDSQPVRIKSTISKPPEIVKTPAIKISFGTSGNGMVVQIPPKPAQHVESISADAKATKKAMKKAKKEAKMKRSISPGHSPSLNALSPELSLKVERSFSTSPVIPLIASHQDDEMCTTPFWAETDFTSLSLLEPQTNESCEITVKRKKQKKRRRSSKNLKESDSFCDSGGSNCQDLGGSISSVSNSSLNQDCSIQELGTTSPLALSGKIVGYESISNPSTPEPLQSFCKDSSSLPQRRKSVPASSTSISEETPPTPRVCINLKRVDKNAYVPLPTLHSISCHDEEEEDPAVSENNGVETDVCDPSEFPVNSSSNENEMDVGALTSESVDYYKDKGTECVYRKGDIVWGKLPSCPWWPGKISDILLCSSDDARAIISWYKSSTQSCVLFKMVLPFTEYFEGKYEKRRRRGLYQSAVNAAMSEAHKFDHEDFNHPTDPH